MNTPALLASDKPAARAWATKHTVWFVLPRRAGATHLRAGQWITVTRTHKSTPKRRSQIARWKAKQPVFVAQNVVSAGAAQGERVTA